ncbi:MAG: hypothetical protein HKL90_08845 [Elusimicrobia bacterium]|nr:hypothetical protein [Elusimicrobiota bacterium]
MDDPIPGLLARIEVLRVPRRELATFGATRVDYQLVSDADGMPGRARLREGTVLSERPKILTPEAFGERFTGFGDNAAPYARWAESSYRDLLRALEYNFRNQDLRTRVLQRDPRELTASLLAEDASGAVLTCPDAAWPLALIKLSLDEAARSFPGHVRDLERRGLFSADRGEDARRRREIEALFESARADRSQADALGRKLRGYGLFAEYEDRFLALFRSDPG